MRKTTSASIASPARTCQSIASPPMSADATRTISRRTIAQCVSRTGASQTRLLTEPVASDDCVAIAVSTGPPLPEERNSRTPRRATMGFEYRLRLKLACHALYSVQQHLDGDRGEHEPHEALEGADHPLAQLALQPSGRQQHQGR